jgi:hypothetical protein
LSSRKNKVLKKRDKVFKDLVALALYEQKLTPVVNCRSRALPVYKVMTNYIDALKEETTLYRDLSAELAESTRKLNASIDQLAAVRRELFGDELADASARQRKSELWEP